MPAWSPFSIAAPAHAATPGTWQAAGAADFLKGELENLAVDGRGRLTLAPASTVLHEAGTPFIWTLVEGANGVLYAGTGNDGQVLAIDPSGKSHVFFDAEQLEVHALAPTERGHVLLVMSVGLYVAARGMMALA